MELVGVLALPVVTVAPRDAAEAPPGAVTAGALSATAVAEADPDHKVKNTTKKREREEAAVVVLVAEEVGVAAVGATEAPHAPLLLLLHLAHLLLRPQRGRFCRRRSSCRPPRRSKSMTLKTGS